MKHIILPLMAVAALALAGCSTPTHVSSGEIKARTFSFVDRGTQAPPPGTEQRLAVHAMIQEAITKNLAARGVQRVPTGGDVTVAYLVILGNNVVTTSINDYFGYGRDANALLDKAHSATISKKDPNSFEAGTLLIDIIETKDYKLRERSYATRPVIRNLSNEARAERIQAVVDEILGHVHIVP